MELRGIQQLLRENENDASPEQRQNWHLSAAGYGIHWPDIDEDLSTQGLPWGAPSTERSWARTQPPPGLLIASVKAACVRVSAYRRRRNTIGYHQLLQDL